MKSSGRGDLYASRQELMQKREELRNRPPEVPRHMLEGHLPQGPHFVEAVPSLIDELAKLLKIPRESLDSSFDSLQLVDKALKKVRPKKRILEIPNLFPGLIAYTGEVMRKATGGEWWLNEVAGPIYEPYIRYGPGSRYMDAWGEMYKSITEPRALSVATIVYAELAHAGGSGPVFVTDVDEENEYETTVERVKLLNGQEVYRVGVRRRTP
ncbi:hypothetical protein [Polyangium jinanense]|uniref:Uncharacterized protein n=1 Tax=Polyangium jinanense TaxID=2829994 RepID=A0A9X3WWG0_9BACT|nr:hypothetical protein [Polyangium jinanense]MDC3953512.1 hypothetical protein [Polyangium jinanense]MDC3979367.1 hypothetical protein [Polyangium jinanense]